MEDAVGIGLRQAIPHHAHSGGEGRAGEVAEGLRAFGDETGALAEVGILLRGLGDGRQGVEVGLKVARFCQSPARVDGFLVGFEAEGCPVSFGEGLVEVFEASGGQGRQECA